jgi:hypothetical protein
MSNDVWSINPSDEEFKRLYQHWEWSPEYESARCPAMLTEFQCELMAHHPDNVHHLTRALSQSGLRK